MRFNLVVVLPFVTFFAPVARAELELFFGLLHAHTSFSDGSGTPDDAYTMAREAGLDFFAVTEHNHRKAAGRDGIFLTPDLYDELKRSARAHTKSGEFVAIFGQEVSTNSAGNHVNVFNASEICDIEKGDFKTLYEEWLPLHPEVPFIQFNHPNFRKDQRQSTKPKERNNDYGIDDYKATFPS